jgi:hypothetical protein
MDAEVGKLIQAIQVRVGWKTNLETGRADSKVK